MSLFDIESKKEELKKLEEQTQQESFWQQDTSISSKVLAKIKELKHKIDEFELAQNEASNLIELTELANLEVDEEVAKDILKSTKKLEYDVEKIQLETLLSGKYDRTNAILTLHPGAGGTESQDWAEMLYRMYTRWATKKGYEYAIDHPSKAAEILHEDALSDTDLKFLKESQKYLSSQYAKDADSWGVMKDSVWDNYTDFMYETGLISQKIDAKDQYTNEFVK